MNLWELLCVYVCTKWLTQTTNTLFNVNKYIICKYMNYDIYKWLKSNAPWSCPSCRHRSQGHSPPHTLLPPPLSTPQWWCCPLWCILWAAWWGSLVLVVEWVMVVEWWWLGEWVVGWVMVVQWVCGVYGVRWLVLWGGWWFCGWVGGGFVGGFVRSRWGCWDLWVTGCEDLCEEWVCLVLWEGGLDCFCELFSWRREIWKSW